MYTRTGLCTQRRTDRHVQRAPSHRTRRIPMHLTCVYAPQPICLFVCVSVCLPAWLSGLPRTLQSKSRHREWPQTQTVSLHHTALQRPAAPPPTHPSGVSAHPLTPPHRCIHTEPHVQAHMHTDRHMCMCVCVCVCMLVPLCVCVSGAQGAPHHNRAW
jgi:hypothetical protein